jgi:hypothetical protein
VEHLGEFLVHNTCYSKYILTLTSQFVRSIQVKSRQTNNGHMNEERYNKISGGIKQRLNMAKSCRTERQTDHQKQSQFARRRPTDMPNKPFDATDRETYSKCWSSKSKERKYQLTQVKRPPLVYCIAKHSTRPQVTPATVVQRNNQIAKQPNSISPF